MKIKFYALFFSLLLAAVTAGSAFAAVDSVDILIKALVNKGIITEDDAASVRAEIATIRQDEEAARKSYNVTGKRPIKISGYLQERFTHSSRAGFNDTLETRRLRLIFAGDATPAVDYYIQTDLAGSRKGVTDAKLDQERLVTKTGLFSKPIVLDAIIGYKFEGNGKLSIGQQKIPFGQESLISDAALDTINRSQVTETLVPGRSNGSQGRDIGVQFAGTKSLNDEGTRQIEYTIGLFNGAGINVTDDNDRKDPAARLAWKPGIEGLTLAADYYNGRTGATRTHLNRQGLEGAYLRGPWALKGEYLWGKDGMVKKNGWYTTLVRRLGPNTQGVVRYDRLDPNTALADDASNTLTLGFNWFLNKDGYTRWQLNYERHREEKVQVSDDQILAQFQAGF